mgnify:CR=1 FL=1
MIPEGGGHAVFDVLVSVVVSHVLLLHILEELDFEVTSEMEPEMHGVIVHLRDDEPRHKASSENDTQEVMLKCPNPACNFQDMPEWNYNSKLLV